MNTNGPVVLGLDLGTSAVKVVAVDTDGTVCARSRSPYPTLRPEPGAAEQEPADWWSAVDIALSEVARTVSPDRWRGVGLSAMLPTLVELDEAGAPVGSAITWEDARAEPDAEVLLTRFGDVALYRITGQRFDGRYLGPMHARLQRLGRAGAVVSGAKDVLFAELTGELLTDPSTAAGSAVFDIERGEWDPDLVAAVGIPALPEVFNAATTRPMRARWRERWGLPADFPVILGGADSVLGALGVGAERHGDVAVIAGSSAIVLGISELPARDPYLRYLVTPLAGPGWGLEMDLLAMGSAFEAVARMLGMAGPAELLEAAAEISAGEAPVFLPYLTPGEQAALWDPSLTGVVHGLRLDMDRRHLSRALLTGVIVELSRCIKILESTTGVAGPVLLGGGSAVSPILWQDLADATGRDVLVEPDMSDHSALGAALFAGMSLGEHITRTPQRHRVSPRVDRIAWWSETAARHDELRLACGKSLR